MREVTKLGIILLIIAGVAAAILGWVNQITKGPIEEQTIAANNLARQEILSQADEFVQTDINNGENYSIISEIYEGKSNEAVIGYTLKTTPSGYGGEVVVMVGIDTDGVITGVSIGNHNETPGLGAKASDADFKDQYIDKSSDKQIEVIKAGSPSENEIVSISGATITSRAVTHGVNEALRYFNEELNK